MKTYTFHEDPGHGWLAVPVAEIVCTGLHTKISRYSFVSRDRETAYLEEDCDAPKFIKEIGLTREEIRTVHSNSESFIRDLPRYREVFNLPNYEGLL